MCYESEYRKILIKTVPQYKVNFYNITYASYMIGMN